MTVKHNLHMFEDMNTTGPAKSVRGRGRHYSYSKENLAGRLSLVRLLAIEIEGERDENHAGGEKCFHTGICFAQKSLSLRTQG